MKVTKVAVAHFSAVVRQKSTHIRHALRQRGVTILPWKELSQADGAIVYNIHGSSLGHIQRAYAMGKPILSLQEGMYALGWSGTLPGMRQECKRANNLNIMQFVWSRLDVENYVKTGKRKELLQHYGNPEHDQLLLPPNLTRKSLGIPEHAFVVTRIDQYAHPRGGPSWKDINEMTRHVCGLTKLDPRVWVIHCMHPKNRTHTNLTTVGQERNLTRPFKYPIFDTLRLSDLIVTVSSTEGITAAILGKPIIQYDTSRSNERWPFSQHRVAKRAVSQRELINTTQQAIDGKLNLKPKVNYRQEYYVDGKCAERTAKAIIRYFIAK